VLLVLLVLQLPLAPCLFVLDQVSICEDLYSLQAVLRKPDQMDLFGVGISLSTAR